MASPLNDCHLRLMHQPNEEETREGVFWHHLNLLFFVPHPFQMAATAQVASSGTTIKFAPVNGSDTMMKNNRQESINTKHQCITVMKEYESKSLEELRMEDYAENRFVICHDNLISYGVGKKSSEIVGINQIFIML